MRPYTAITNSIFDRIVRSSKHRHKTVRVAAFGLAAVIAGGTVYHVTVRPGDTLSSIAQRACGSAADWTGIYQQNPGVIGSNPDLIFPGQRLTFHCDAAAIKTAMAASSADPPADPPKADPPSGTYHGSSSMQACIIARESGGNSQVTNSSGHYGLYQFSYSTWVAHGGDGADFGHASIAEQNQVYNQTVADDGYADWAPYDGC